MRKNNIQDMTIHEQLEYIAEQICSDYCRYPAIYHESYLADVYKDEDEANDAMGDEVCIKCPLMRF